MLENREDRSAFFVEDSLRYVGKDQFSRILFRSDVAVTFLPTEFMDLSLVGWTLQRSLTSREWTRSDQKKRSRRRPMPLTGIRFVLVEGESDGPDDPYSMGSLVVETSRTETHPWKTPRLNSTVRWNEILGEKDPFDWWLEVDIYRRCNLWSFLSGSCYSRCRSVR